MLVGRHIVSKDLIVPLREPAFAAHVCAVEGKRCLGHVLEPTHLHLHAVWIVELFIHRATHSNLQKLFTQGFELEFWNSTGIQKPREET